jgi:MYXO-CTERM domain-containing protein
VAIASSDAGSLVVWPDAYWDDGGSGGYVRGTLLSTQGTVLTPNGIDIGVLDEITFDVAAAFDGTRYGVAWTHPFEAQAWARQVAEAGIPLGPGPVLLADEAGGELAIAAAAFDGASTWITWTHTSWQPPFERLMGARLGPTGQPLDPAPHLLSKRASGAALAPGAGGSLVAWCDPGEGGHFRDTSVFGARLDPQGAVLDDPIPISTSAGAQRDPSVAFNGHHYVVAWTDDRGDAVTGHRNVYATRVTPAGTALDPLGIRIASGAGWQFQPLAVFDGLNTLILWWASGPPLDNGYPSYHVKGARLTPLGTVLDPIPINIGLSAYEDAYIDRHRMFVASSDGESTLVAISPSSSAVDEGIAAIRVSHAGEVSAPATLATFDGAVITSALSYDGENHLLVWTQPHFNERRAVGARVTPDGQVLDAPGFVIAGDIDCGGCVAVAFDGQNHLVVWPRFREEPGWTIVSELRFTRVTPDGVVLDPEGIVIHEAGPFPAGCYMSYTESDPAIVFDGGRTVVAWSERADPCDWSSIQLRGAEITPDGAVASVFPVLDEPSLARSPALTTTGYGEALVAYARFVEEPPFGAVRVRLRRVGDCDPAACPTGLCVDGVCCDTPCGDGDPSDCVACSVANGAPADGVCAPLDGVACDDMNACTQGDACHAGACVPGAPAECAGPELECREAPTCDPAVGCWAPDKPDGTPCAGGVCVGGACAPTGAGGGGGQGGAGGGPGESGEPREPDALVASGGCGCRAAGAPNAPAAPALLALLAVAALRTRSRRPLPRSSA